MDYFDIVPKPMDFGTIKKKLLHNVYESARDFVDDMSLVWGNCIRYNG
jgi:transcriptional activator SPT7